MTQTNPTTDPNPAAFTQSKSVLTSTTCWGIAVAMIFGWLSKHSWWVFDKNTTAQALAEVASYLGLAIAAYGRYRATHKITLPSLPTSTAASKLLILGCALAMVIAGCATSAQFKAGAKKYAPDVTSECRSYLSADSTLSPAVLNQRIAELSALDADVANLSSIDRNRVAADWNQVKAWWMAYVDADANLDSDAKAARHLTATSFDKLIADDAQRPFAQMVPVAPIVPTVPTTQP